MWRHQHTPVADGTSQNPNRKTGRTLKAEDIPANPEHNHYPETRPDRYLTCQFVVYARFQPRQPDSPYVKQGRDKQRILPEHLYYIPVHERMDSSLRSATGTFPPCQKHKRALRYPFMHDRIDEIIRYADQQNGGSNIYPCIGFTFLQECLQQLESHK